MVEDAVEEDLLRPNESVLAFFVNLTFRQPHLSSTSLFVNLPFRQPPFFVNLPFSSTSLFVNLTFRQPSAYILLSLVLRLVSRDLAIRIA